jgi:hypothetical protein
VPEPLYGKPVDVIVARSIGLFRIYAWNGDDWVDTSRTQYVRAVGMVEGWLWNEEFYVAHWLGAAGWCAAIPATPVRVRLLEDLASGAQCDCSVQRFDGSAWADFETIQIREAIGVADAIPADTIGFASYVDKHAKWCLTSAACPAES